MRVILHCGVIAALLLSVAWAAPQGADDHEGHDHGPHTADHHHHLHHGDDEPHPKHEGQETNALSQPNAEFAFDLYKKLSALPEQSNVFFSPLSISMALSMLALGAKGETFTQLYQTLGYGEMTQAVVNEAYKKIFHLLGHNKHLQLDASNAVAVRRGTKLVPKFIDDATRNYKSGIFIVDFTKPDVAVMINKYIAQQTKNTITDMVKKVDPDTIMMLINCIYFRGEWQTHFNEFTRKADFHMDDSTKVTVEMMWSEGEYEFYEDKENFTTVLRLPYKGGASMIIVMPDEGKMKEVEDSITLTHIRHWEESLTTGSMALHLPKISITGKYSLKQTLETMGVVSVFSDTADFSGMTERKMLVSKVEHKAILHIDEKGTEAAGATPIMLMERAFFEPPKTITINRPFLLFIMDSDTQSVLFMGKISNPSSL